jgi:hypothetical protein
MKMKSPILLASTLLALGMPIAAQARCDRFQNDTFTLNLPANITVPDSLPVGSVITRQAFSGTAPAYFANCTVATHSGVFGRYSRLQDPATGAYHTEVPGIGLRITMTWADGGPAAFANTGTADGVSLWMYSRINGAPQTISNNDTRTVAVSSNRAVLPLRVAYHKNGTVSSDTLISSTTVNITYN